MATIYCESESKRLRCYAGKDITSAVRRMPISFIHQDLGLIDWMTLTENICLTLAIRGALGSSNGRARASSRNVRSQKPAPISIPISASRI